MPLLATVVGLGGLGGSAVGKGEGKKLFAILAPRAHLNLGLHLCMWTAFHYNNEE